MKLAAIKALFPSDVRATAGWLHIAVAEEKVAEISGWFTGRPELAATLAAANGLQTDTVGRGTTVRIAVEFLLPPFRDAPALDETEPPKLDYAEDEKGRYALYRLRKGEALYSAVVVRFTGRVHAADVIELANSIAVRSGIEDVHAIPVGYPVKIPIDALSEEFLPPDDPRGRAFALERAETAQFARPERAKGLAGVRVVIDAGHGGPDTGTIHGGLWEATYVYDVAVRLRKLLLHAGSLDPRAELLLMFADRRQHLTESVEPALAAGTSTSFARLSKSIEPSNRIGVTNATMLPETCFTPENEAAMVLGTTVAYKAHTYQRMIRHLLLTGALMAVSIGKKVPDFTLPATGDQTIRLKDLRGQNLVLYFYPKDSTPGCTQEGQEFSDLQAKFKRANTVILGVSRDSIKSHENFKAKQEFTFELLSDADEALCNLFDVIKMKNMYGEQVRGIERSTFLIDSNGVLQQEWRKVKVTGHAEEVLAAAKAIAGK